jgi:flavodoxin
MDTSIASAYNVAMAVLVVYESKQDHTRAVADAIADAVADYDVPTLTRSVDEAKPTHVESASVLIAGCITPGDVPFGGKPTQRMAAWINDLDSLEGKPVAVFCAYKFFPHTFADTTTRVAETLSKLTARFELRGGMVAASQGINLKSIDKGAKGLVDQILGHIRED